jgi:hypothetical protein
MKIFQRRPVENENENILKAVSAENDSLAEEKRNPQLAMKWERRNDIL